MQRTLLDELFVEHEIDDYVRWYYTPMAVAWSRHLAPRATVYDCMDELSKFTQAPADIGVLEDELFERADLVFTGGRSLYEAKRRRARYEPGAYDLRAPAPRPTAIAALARALAAGEPFDQPAAGGPGWWRRDERLRFRPSPSAGRPTDGPSATARARSS